MDILIFSVVVAAAAFLLWQCHSKRKHLLVELKACQEKCARAIDTAQADNTRWNSLHQSQLEEIAQLHKRSQVFQGRLKEVEPYLGIVDAQREAAQMVDQAQKRAQDIVAKGQGDSDALAQKAAERLAQADKIALRAIQTARTTAAQIEAEARQRAGEAMDLKGRESELREQVQALENRVKGYDDSYLQPATLLLEGLADHYGHEDAAQALKHARTNTKDMLRSETAADCDYVENHRRSTAIRFVIMAFNGEVDAILSLVKTDNVGVLKRKIQDAFSLVNLHGAAFRNARVTQAFFGVSFGGA